MKKPKALYFNTRQMAYNKETGGMVISTRSYEQMKKDPTLKVKTERDTVLEAWAGLSDEDPYVIMSSPDKITPDRAIACAEWFMELADWLAYKGVK